MDKKFYLLEDCPYCGGDLRDAGISKLGNNILNCIKCGRTMIESDIDKVRKEKDENIKTRE